MTQTTKINKSLATGAMMQAFMRVMREQGVGFAVKRSIQYVRNLRNMARILKATSIEERFTAIYRENFWGNEESVSGAGSTLAYTQNLRQQLAHLFERMHIRTVLDAPCGDYNWMSRIVAQTGITYIGADIVKDLIDTLKEKHRAPSVNFLHMDITKDLFPKADLWICRDCLFHLSDADIQRALKQFLVAGIPYVLTTTHKNLPGYEFVNSNINTSDFRFIDLFEAPYSLPRDVQFRVDDFLAPEQPRELCLWTREQIATAMQ